jgi:hypothetical protein
VRVLEDDRPEGSGAAPVVSIDVCRCGSTHGAGTPHDVPVWPLAAAWQHLTAVPVADDDDEDDDEDDEPDPADLPWWDARSRPERRRAILPLVLLGELQAGVLLRALWEVLQMPAGPGA